MSRPPTDLDEVDSPPNPASSAVWWDCTHDYNGVVGFLNYGKIRDAFPEDVVGTWEEDDGGEWLSIGRNNRVTNSTRTVHDESSPVRQIFGGQLHTKVWHRS